MGKSRTGKKNGPIPQVCIMTVIGADQVGIIAKLATAMADANINILDVNQNIMESWFVMTMAVDISGTSVSLENIRKKLDRLAEKMSLKIAFQDENIFKAMHRI